MDPQTILQIIRENAYRGIERIEGPNGPTFRPAIIIDAVDFELVRLATQAPRDD